MKKSKPLNVKDRLMSEYISIGGEIMTRADAVMMLQNEHVPPHAIDICVFGVDALTEQELLQVARTGLVFALRCEIIDKCWDK